jgi:hypothetical protein
VTWAFVVASAIKRAGFTRVTFTPVRVSAAVLALRLSASGDRTKGVADYRLAATRPRAGFSIEAVRFRSDPGTVGNLWLLRFARSGGPPRRARKETRPSAVRGHSALFLNRHVCAKRSFQEEKTVFLNLEDGLIPRADAEYDTKPNGSR